MNAKLPLAETLQKIHAGKFLEAFAVDLQSKQMVVLVHHVAPQSINNYTGSVHPLPMMQLSPKIRQAMAMEQAEYKQWSRAAYDFAQAYFAEQDLVERYVALFQG